MIDISYYSVNTQQAIQEFYNMNERTIDVIFGSFDSYQESIKPHIEFNMQTNDIRNIVERVGSQIYVKELNEKIRLLQKQKNEMYSQQTIENKSTKEVKQLLKEIRQLEKQILQLKHQHVSEYNFACVILKHMSI